TGIDGGEAGVAVRTRSDPLHESPDRAWLQRCRPDGCVPPEDRAGRRGRIAIREIAQRQTMTVAAVLAECGNLPEIGEQPVPPGARKDAAPGDGRAIVGRTRSGERIESQPAVDGQPRCD